MPGLASRHRALFALLGRELEDSAAAEEFEAGRVGDVQVAAEAGSAVQIPLLVHNQRPEFRVTPVGAALEIPECGLITRGIQLVHCSAEGAKLAESAGVGGAVEIALAIPKQPTIEISSIGASLKGVEGGLRSGFRGRVDELLV
jgi:hypothetical protein